MGAISEEPDMIVYPSSDGKPMAETGIHVGAIHLLFKLLEEFFGDRPDVFLAADMFWYWKKGRTKTTAPDVMVVPGVGNHTRRSFFSWEENGAVPAVVFEMASENTWRNDLGFKRHLYERRGVKEYFIFDPEELYLRPRLIGFRLHGKRYRSLFAAEGSLSSDLGFDLRAEGQSLRLYDRTTGRQIPTRREKVEIAETNALSQLQKAHRAVEEAHRAVQAAQRAEAETQTQKHRADDLVLEIERLKALLAAQGIHG